MKFISTRNSNHSVNFSHAVKKGLAADGGLYYPIHIPKLSKDFFDHITTYHKVEIATQALLPYVNEEMDRSSLEQIVDETLAFNIPLVHVKENIYSLELYHGPTQAFKDVGARFMSRSLAYFNEESDVHILVATSGDTGSAVANGFYDIPGIKVHILFPKDKVSNYQQYQMTSLGKNIRAYEVDGNFDDCQKIVKQAFGDKALNEKLTISSANSINIARLLPQMTYYFLAYQQIKKLGIDKNIVISVPSGNLGNITAGLIGKHMGLPIKRFISSHNANDTFVKYLQDGNYQPIQSVQTLSNAMDVGAPSNIERIDTLYTDINDLRKDVSGYSFDDKITLNKISEEYHQQDYLLDPHGAVGILGLEQDINVDELGIFLETAHPQKFASVIRQAIPSYKVEIPDLSNCHKTSINNDYNAFIDALLS